MRKPDFWPVQWFLNGQKWGVKKASLYVHFEGLKTDSYFGKNKTELGRSDRKKGFFNTLLMRKPDFWPVQWFLNGQKWGVKKASLYVHFEGLKTDSYFGKTRPNWGGQIEKRAFLTLFWWEILISDLSSGF